MKNIIITGAAGNLGRAVTSTFLEKGYKVVATVETEEARSHLAGHENLETHIVDLTNEKATNDFVIEAINKLKKIDAAILLAGGWAGGSVAKTSINDINQQVQLNFSTAYNVARPAFTHMLQNGSGRIVFIGARPGLDAAAGKGMIAYGLSKSMLFKLSDYMNAEAKGKNVVTTVVAPSTIDTAMNRKSMPDADPSAWVKPEAIAEILEFIVSDKGNTLRETVLKVYNNA